MVHVFSHIKVFAYQSLTRTTDCCIGLLFLHSPLYRALESRSPWARTSFGLEERQTFSETAVTTHWLHTIIMTFCRQTSDFATPKGMTESILPAHALHVYITERLHVGDLRVATTKGKALLLGKKSKGLLNKSFMRVKCLNRFCRTHGRRATYCTHSLPDRLFRHISASGKDMDGTVNDVYQKLLDVSQEAPSENKRKKAIDKYVRKLETKYFQAQSSFMTALISKHNEYWMPKPSENNDNSDRKRLSDFRKDLKNRKKGKTANSS